MVSLLWIPQGPALPPGLTLAQSSGGNRSGSLSTAAGVVALFSGCSGTQYLGADGACHNAAAAGANAALSNLAAVAVNAPLLPGADNSIALNDATHRYTNAFVTAFTCGITGTTSCVITGSGSTSGTATFTWPATAGTVSNAVVSSNAFTVAGSTAGTIIRGNNGTTGNSCATSTNLGLDTSPTGGILWNGSGAFFDCYSGVANIEFTNQSNGGLILQAAIPLGFSSSTPDVAFQDIGISRKSAGILSITGAGAGNHTVGDTTGSVAGSSFRSAGTKFTTNAGCGESAGTIAGGASAGAITTAGSTSCTTIVTFGDTDTTVTRWACFAHDITTTADYANPRVSSNTTTATIVTGTIVAGDVIELACLGY